MKTEHHNLNIKLVSEQVFFINEPEITGMFCGCGLDFCPTGSGSMGQTSPPTTCPGMPVNRRIMCECMSHWTCTRTAYFRAVLAYFQCADSRSELGFSRSIEQVITRLEIYDQVLFARERSKPWKDDCASPDHSGQAPRHSRHAAEIARVIVDGLLQVARNSCTNELFPYKTIDMLCRECGFDMVEW